jgi:hypothetical protein
MCLLYAPGICLKKASVTDIFGYPREPPWGLSMQHTEISGCLYITTSSRVCQGCISGLMFWTKKGVIEMPLLQAAGGKVQSGSRCPVSPPRPDRRLTRIATWIVAWTAMPRQRERKAPRSLLPERSAKLTPSFGRPIWRLQMPILGPKTEDPYHIPGSIPRKILRNPEAKTGLEKTWLRWLSTRSSSVVGVETSVRSG